MRARAPVWPDGRGDDALGAPLHLGGGAAREGQQQDAAGIGAVDDQMGDAVRQRVGLARAGAGNHQQRPGDVGADAGNAVLDRAALLGIEGLQVGGIRHPRVRTMLSSAQPDHDSFPSAKRCRGRCPIPQSVAKRVDHSRQTIDDSGRGRRIATC